MAETHRPSRPAADAAAAVHLPRQQQQPRQRPGPFYATNARWPRAQNWAHGDDKRSWGRGKRGLERRDGDGGRDDEAEERRGAVDNSLESLAALGCDGGILQGPRGTDPNQTPRPVGGGIGDAEVMSPERLKRLHQLQRSRLLLASAQGDASGAIRLLREACLARGGEGPTSRVPFGSLACAATENGTTPLMMAAVRGDTELVRELLSCGADVRAAQHDTGATAAHLAAQRNNVEALALILDAASSGTAGSDVQDATTDATLALLCMSTRAGQDTVLMAGARGNALEASQYILKRYWELTATGRGRGAAAPDGQKTAAFADENHHREYNLEKDVLGLLGAMNIVASSRGAPDGRAATRDVDRPRRRTRQLMDALLGHISRSPTTRSKARAPAAGCAPARGPTVVCSKSKSRAAAHLTTAATISVRSGSLDALASLLHHVPALLNMNTNRQRDTLLAHAVRMDRADAVEALLAHEDCNLLCKDASGRSLLHVAAEHDAGGACAALLDGPMDSVRRKQVAEYLIESIDDTGDTPLIVAVRRSSEVVVDLLLRAGAATHVTSGAGKVAGAGTKRTPLHVAASQPHARGGGISGGCGSASVESSNLRIVRKLLGACGDGVLAVDSSGRVPRQLAADCGNIAVAELLAAHARRMYLVDVQGGA